MNTKIIFFLFLFILPSISKAQFGSPDNLPNAAVNTVVAALHSFKRSDVPKDTISGVCTYNGGSCNGAEISLYRNDQRIFVTTLTSLGGFKIPNLKIKETYVLKVSWAKPGLSEKRSVETGEFIEILLKKLENNIK